MSTRRNEDNEERESAAAPGPRTWFPIPSIILKVPSD